MRFRPHRPAGFTLIELMIVVILIGIFSGLMVAEMRGTYEDALLRSTARKIISAVNLASSKAITSNQAHALVLEPEEGRLRIVLDRESGSLEEEKLDARIQVDVHPLPPQGDDEAEPASEGQPATERRSERIRFFPDGTADGCEIALRDRLGVEVLLHINPVTGRARVLNQEAAP